MKANFQNEKYDNLEKIIMTRDKFKMIHSELIQQVQCIENNLKVIYAAMCKGNVKSNLQSLNNANLGKIARELEKLDYSDEQAFQKIAQRLHYDENRTYDPFQKTEEMRIAILNKYR